MPHYVVTDQQNSEIIRYSAAVVQSHDYPLDLYTHTEFDPDVGPIVTTGRTMTKLEYLRRFTQAERIAIRTVAASNPVLDDYMQLLELATEINTADPDTVAAVHMLEAAGLIAAGRAGEILNA